MTNFKDKLNYFRSLEVATSSEFSEALSAVESPVIENITESSSSEEVYQDAASLEVSESVLEDSYKSPIFEEKEPAAVIDVSDDNKCHSCEELKAQNLKLNMLLLKYRNMPPLRDEEKEALIHENESLKQALRVLQGSIDELIALNDENADTVHRLQSLISNKL